MSSSSGQQQQQQGKVGIDVPLSEYRCANAWIERREPLNHSGPGRLICQKMAPLPHLAASQHLSSRGGTYTVKSLVLF